MGIHFSQRQVRRQFFIFLFWLMLAAGFDSCQKNSSKLSPTPPSTPVTVDSATAKPITYSTAQGMGSITLTNSPLLMLPGAAAGGKIAFASGINNSIYALVDSAYVFDTLENNWLYYQLGTFNSPPNSHYLGTAAGAGTKILFAGGLQQSQLVAEVDIYDVETAQLTTGQLSSARAGSSGASAGSIIAFGGGQGVGGFSSDVDLYDAGTGVWNTGQLSVPREFLAAAGAGSNILFAGGQTGPANDVQHTAPVTDVVDIYDINTKLWNTARLSVARSYVVGASSENKIVFAGGLLENGTFSNALDIYDVGTGQWTSGTLGGNGREYSCAVASGNLILFAGGQNSQGPYPSIDIYNTNSGSWSSVPLLKPGLKLSGAATGSTVIFAGGTGTSPAIAQVYQLK
jgi:Kelch motif